MELENMKALWQEYDRNLQTSNILNEKMVKHMLAEKSNERLSSFVKMEYLSLAIAGICLMIFAALWFKVGSEMQVIVPYVASLLFFIFLLGWSMYKLKLIHEIDTYSDSIVKTRERIQKLQLLFAREKVWSLILMPFVMCILAPLLHHWVWGGFFSDHLKTYALRLTVGYGVFIVLTYWMYKTLYSKNIKIILGNLAEIEALKKE